jgi:pilus assembly protein Flp/PilA
MSDMVLAFWTRVQNLKLDADERGATAVEYGMLVALIAAVIIATVAVLGGKINTAFNTISSKLP